MKKLVFCCLCILAFMACGERKSIMGRWAMEVEDSGATFFLLPDDTICKPELLIDRDTVYMEIRSDGIVTSREFLGVYAITNNELKVTNRMGDSRTCSYVIEGDSLIVSDKDDPNKIVMRLRRIETREK